MLFQSFGTENCSQYFSKEAGDGKIQTAQPQFSIYSDHLQTFDAKVSISDHSKDVTDHEEMEIHPSVTAALVPETFCARNEIFDDKNNTGIFSCAHFFSVRSLLVRWQEGNTHSGQASTLIALFVYSLT